MRVVSVRKSGHHYIRKDELDNGLDEPVLTAPDSLVPVAEQCDPVFLDCGSGLSGFVEVGLSESEI